MMDFNISNEAYFRNRTPDCFAQNARNDNDCSCV